MACGQGTHPSRFLCADRSSGRPSRAPRARGHREAGPTGRIHLLPRRICHPGGEQHGGRSARRCAQRWRGLERWLGGCGASRRVRCGPWRTSWDLRALNRPSPTEAGPSLPSVIGRSRRSHGGAEATAEPRSNGDILVSRRGLFEGIEHVRIDPGFSSWRPASSEDDLILYTERHNSVLSLKRSVTEATTPWEVGVLLVSRREQFGRFEYDRIQPKSLRGDHGIGSPSAELEAA